MCHIYARLIGLKLALPYNYAHLCMPGVIRGIRPALCPLSVAPVACTTHATMRSDASCVRTPPVSPPAYVGRARPTAQRRAAHGRRTRRRVHRARRPQLHEHSSEALGRAPALPAAGRAGEGATSQREVGGSRSPPRQRGTGGHNTATMPNTIVYATTGFGDRTGTALAYSLRRQLHGVTLYKTA